MPEGLKRYYGQGHLHFITFSCHHRLPLWSAGRNSELRGFWQRRFYDFNLFSEKKRLKKLQSMHWNPVQRNLVREPQHWPWSSFNFYWETGTVLLEMDPF
jgi:hypothetical protein